MRWVKFTVVTVDSAVNMRGGEGGIKCRISIKSKEEAKQMKGRGKIVQNCNRVSLNRHKNDNQKTWVYPQGI